MKDAENGSASFILLRLAGELIIIGRVFSPPGAARERSYDMKRKCRGLLLALGMLFVLSACGQSEQLPTVEERLLANL